MAVITTVLYETGGNLRIMSAAELDEIRWLAAYFYQQTPVADLTYVASGGDLSPTMTDRRYQAGAAITGRVSSYAGEALTEDISAIDTTYDRISMTRLSSTSAVEPSENASGTAFPIYWDGVNKKIKAMTKTDFFDTFIGYTITNGLVGTGSVNKMAAGTYTVLTNSASIAGNPGTTIVNASPIFVDTRADAAAYTADGIAETQDQPTTINSYYLHKITQSTKPTYNMPLFLRQDGTGVQVYTTATFEDMIDQYMQSATFGLTGYSITYEMGTSVTNQKGTNINDTYLSGTSADGYTEYLASVDDYRSQEFPNGAVAILNSYKLGISTSASYQVSVNSSTANEGDTVTFTVSTTNVAPGTVPYTITGISASDITSGALSGNITTTGSSSSASGTTSITLANDVTTEGTEIATFTAGGSSVTVTISDTSTNSGGGGATETIQLDGTSSLPEGNGVPPLTDGSINVGWRFGSDGTVSHYNSDNSPQYSTAGHSAWCQQSGSAATPSGSYYINIDTVILSDGVYQTPTYTSGWTTLNSSTSRSFTFTDNRLSSGYGTESVSFRVRISADSGGNTQTTSNQYSATSPIYKWEVQQIGASAWALYVYWNGNLQYYNEYVQEIDIPQSSVTGDDGYNYARGTFQSGDTYAVTQNIPGILATGYYIFNYEGGA